MASGYIGKISAVVTANTSLLSRELVKSAKDANRFANSLKNSIDRGADAASASIEKIFTPLQMLERKLKLAESRGLKLNMPSDQIRAFVSASEQINKPLEQASKQFAKLGLDVQGAFLPALNAAQDAAIRVNREIQDTGASSASSFARAQAAVESVTLSLSRLAQAQDLVGKGLTGNELQFRNPAVFGALTASGKATQAAGSLPASRLQDGRIAKQVQEINAYRQALVAAEAKLESLELQPKVDPSEIEAQKKNVQDLAEITERAAEYMSAGIKADALKQSNAEQEKAIANGNRLLQVLSNEEAAQIRLTNQIKAATTASRLSRQEKSERIGVSFRSGEAFSLDLDDREVNAYLQRLGVLKTTLSSLAKQDAAQASEAVRRFGIAVSKALADGSIRSKGVREELLRIQAEAVKATASVANIDAKELGARLRTAGDIGRSGVDKLSLGLNQAAFAIDDLFSSTGGIEFRIRAVQNNLTQLGFILGGTAGLFTALGAAIAGQAVVALVKYINNGRTAKDVADALTASIQKQKDATSELSNAFSEFGDTISNEVFSGALRSADELSERISKVIENLKTLRSEQLATSNQEVANKQAELNVLNERIKSESDVGVLVALRAQRAQAESSLSDAAASAGERISLQEAVDRFSRAIFALEERRATNSPTVTRLEARIQAIRSTSEIISQANIRNFSDLRRLIDQRLSATAEGIGTGGVGAFTRSGDAFNRALGLPFSRQLLRAEEASALQALSVQTQDPVGASEAARVFLQETERLGTALADARERLESFGEESDIKAFSERLDAAGKTLSESLGSVEEAISGIADGKVSFDDLRDAVEKATAQVNTETEDRARLVSEITSKFTEQAESERKERKALVEDIKRQRQQAADQARKDAEESRRMAAQRGADLVMSESERFANELRQGIADIEAFVGPRTVDNVRRSRELAADFVADRAGQMQRQIAPAVFALRDQVTNAALGGPNRAALSASDITTQQGTSELNRLLRGDDPAREQNIVELRKQTAELVGLREDLKNLGVAD